MSRERIKVLLNAGSSYVDGACTAGGNFKVNVENTSLAVTSSTFATETGVSAVNTSVGVSNGHLSTINTSTASCDTKLSTISGNIIDIETLLSGTLTTSGPIAVVTTVFTGSFSNTNLSTAHDTGTAQRVEHTLAGNSSAAATLTLHVSADGTTYYATTITIAANGDFCLSFVNAFRYFKFKCSDIATTSTITGILSSK